MRTLKLTLAYDGTDFAGWQVQPRQRTVQATLEQAILATSGETIRLAACGRTDAGVHAIGQVASFNTTSELPAAVLARALNSRLPGDLSVVAAEDAVAGFHATRDCLSKRYRYLLHVAGTPDVFWRRYAWHYRQPLDAPRMRQAAQALVGTHDFRSFQSSGSRRLSSVRTVREITVTRLARPPAWESGPARATNTQVAEAAHDGEPEPAGSGAWLAIEVEADGFLYNMVRAFVGTLVEVGRGRQSLDWPGDVLMGRARSQAGMTAPAQGLTLIHATYPAGACESST